MIKSIKMKYGFAIFFIFISLAAYTQKNFVKYNFKENKVEKCRIQISQKESDKDYLILMDAILKNTEAGFCFSSKDKNEAIIVKNQSVSTDIIVNEIIANKFDASVIECNPISKKDFLELYCSFSSFHDNKMPEGFPKYINTRNEFKDNYNYTIAKEKWIQMNTNQ